MAMQVGGAWCKSASAASRAVGLPAEFSSGSPSTSSASSSSSSSSRCLAFPKSGLAFDVSKEGGNWVAKKVWERSGRALVVRASYGGGKKSGENESKAVYDAFFLGKALAESINERVGSAIGEFLSDVGRRQAEQRKQIREFQDEVQERAAAAAVKAAQTAKAIEKANASTSTPPSTSSPPESPSPAQPPPSTSGLSNPDDAPTSISIEE